MSAMRMHAQRRLRARLALAAAPDLEAELAPVAVLRPAAANRPQLVFTLIERGKDGSILRDVFPAPTLDEAMIRARCVARSAEAELWVGDQLLDQWTPGR